MTNEELIARLLHEETDLSNCAADRIEALTKQVREMALDVLASSGQAQEAYAAQLAAEAERDRLREAGEKALCHITGYGEASTARIELRAALKGETT